MIYEEDAKSLLLQYSEWLDIEKINPSTPETVDGWTHTNLVDRFLDSRHLGATPLVTYGVS